MVHKLIQWALNSPLIVIILVLALAVCGSYAFLNVNVEAYPDPAPAIIEVVAQWPGSSAEEVERQVTIPLEVALAGMPGLKYTRTKSLYGLSHLRNQFDYGVPFNTAKQEVLNRIMAIQGLPSNVQPVISPETPTGEIFRYTLSNPRDRQGREVPIYTLADLKALQDWSLERVFKKIPRIGDVSSSGGEIKRYEVHPDPDRLRRYGITLQQLQNAIANGNGNGGGDIIVQGHSALNIRGVGLIGRGVDPMQEVLGLELQELENHLAKVAKPLPGRDKQQVLAAFRSAPVTPPLTKDEEYRLKELRRVVGLEAALKATSHLRSEEERRLREIRNTVITSVNNVPVRVDDVVDGGPLDSPGNHLGEHGVVVGHQTRLGMVSLSRPRRDVGGRDMPGVEGSTSFVDENDKIQGIVLLRKDQDSLPALRDVEAAVKELNETPGRLLPGVQVEPYYDRTDLINVTTETVRENLILGMTLVTVILLMFLSNVRSALIVAINIPLALLFAFGVLYVRGKSANLLSIGAVDFGIIVDSSVIMVENIYRHISTGENADLPLKDRILRASHEVEKSLFFSTAIMVCAFIPLFTMKGPEGQIFGPMADTYAFALGGALLLALTVSPVLCLLFFRHLKAKEDNFLVRWLKQSYLRQLEWCLRNRRLALGLFSGLIGTTLFWLFVMPTLKTTFPTLLENVPVLGREFMPELEEGNLWIRGTFPLDVSLERVNTNVAVARAIMRKYPEIGAIVPQIGRPDDGTDPTGFYNAEFFVPLKPESEWPKLKPRQGWKRILGAMRARTKPELVDEMNAELNAMLPGADWNFSQNIRDNVMEALSGVKGDNSVKIFGPDLDELDRIADNVKNRLEKIGGIRDVAVFHIKGQSNIEFGINKEECKRWGIQVQDVQNVIKSAIGGQAFTQMTEGEKSFDITLRWPGRLRADVETILNIPVDVANNSVPGLTTLVSPTGTSVVLPVAPGNALAATVNILSGSPRVPLRKLVVPLDPDGDYNRPGASTIYREQGFRMIAVKFSVRGRDLAAAVAEAQRDTADLVPAPYRTEWSGEFQEMEEAESRLLIVVTLSLGCIVLLLYLAFHSLLDATVVLSNVAGMSVGGIAALIVTDTNFNISAAVGFISILGVAVMNGLLMVATFNHLRALGIPLREALLTGTGRLIRPVMMTALAAIFGLLPAALSTRIGSQSQRPLAIVVVGGMIATLLFANLVPVLYSLYGNREPSADSGGVAH